MKARRFFSGLLALLQWPALLIGAGYSFIGLFELLSPGAFVFGAQNPWPGALLLIMGLVGVGFGWVVRAVRLKICPQSPTAGIVRG